MRVNRPQRWTCLIVLIVCACQPGCNSSEAPQVAIQADGIEMLPPAQIQRALHQLSAHDPRQQMSGLEFVERFPSLAQTHRDVVEQLSISGASAKIKLKANQILESQP